MYTLHLFMLVTGHLPKIDAFDLMLYCGVMVTKFDLEAAFLKCWLTSSFLAILVNEFLQNLGNFSKFSFEIVALCNNNDHLK